MRRGVLLDRLDRRVLAAVRLVDATIGRPIDRPLSVSAEGVRFLRNRSGLYVICRAPGLEALERVFERPPALPAPESVAVELRIEDPLEIYLERLATLLLPRRSEPPAALPDALPDLFRPQPIEMFPGAAAPSRMSWGGLRLMLSAAVSGAPLAGVLATLHRPGEPEAVLGRGLSDQAGAALVLVPGLPVSRPAEGGGPVTTPLTEASLTLLLRRDRAWPVDPDRLGALPPEQVVTPAPVPDIRLRAGTIETRTVEVPLPDEA